jgi:hypothetical protein
MFGGQGVAWSRDQGRTTASPIARWHILMEQLGSKLLGVRNGVVDQAADTALRR